MACIMLIKFLG